MTNKLTDLELCKRIAEIEGKHFGVVQGCPMVSAISSNGGTRWTSFNPLTNKALLFDLMVKHEVEIDYYDMTCSVYKESFVAVSSSKFKSKEYLPRAILECIVEANE